MSRVRRLVSLGVLIGLFLFILSSVFIKEEHYKVVAALFTGGIVLFAVTEVLISIFEQKRLLKELRNPYQTTPPVVDYTSVTATSPPSEWIELPPYPMSQNPTTDTSLSVKVKRVDNTSSTRLIRE